jgi:hypothetical protein
MGTGPATAETRTMPSRPREWTVWQIARLLGLDSRSRIYNEIRSGRLKAKIDPRIRSLTGQSKRYLVSHRELCRWLLVNKFPLDEFRYKLAPGDTALTVGLTPCQVKALSKFRTVPAANLFRLGQLSRDHPAWVIVVSLPAVGWEGGIAAAAEFKRDLGRPYLVALVGPDRGQGRAADYFDVLLPAAVEPQGLAAALERLHKWGDRSEL